AVRQGEIHLGTRGDFAANKSFKIGRGKVVTLTGSAQPGKSDIAKLDKDAVDGFDVWSFNRAQALTASNVSSLRRGRVLTALGGWYYDPFFNCYTFMPYRSRFWSPYGFGFFNNYHDCYGYNPYYGYGNGGYYGGGGTGVVSRPPRVLAGNDRAPIRRGAEGRSLDTGSGLESRSGGFGDSGSSRSVSSPVSTSSPSVISAPAPSRSSGSSDGGGRSMPSRGRP
ncbi:MAG: hypothetical protein ACREAM_10930, partial [Blastocatellia bacterium]